MTPPSFSEFFEQLHGRPPFPWQARAAERLARRSVCPVVVPTSLGKSALIDAAIWAAAHGSWRRIAYVVDRRIVVDAVHERALAICEALRHAQHPGLRALAEKIGDTQVVRLRGGVHNDDDWVLYPERLSVLLTTVDQLGSRLLFRGYGVSPRRWPLHAGFIGSDTLVIVDEAHLSQPFLQTLQAAREAGAGIDLMPMSATLADSGPDTLALADDDLALPTVRQRLQASKPARLLSVDGPEPKLVEALTAQVCQMLAPPTDAAQPPARTVALLVNRVALARQCFERLRKAGVNAVLLIGRTRPAARDPVLQALLPRLAANRPRPPDEAALVVVATQTIEVGADFDFDALVTESAALSALRQRFGRLDRLGLRGHSPACIVKRSGKEDPVYGPAETRTWDWLNQQAGKTGDVGAVGVVDMGLQALQALAQASPPPAEPPTHAASLLPAHLDLLAQTGVGTLEPDLAPWLHGPSDRAPDVSLVWRDDLLPDDTEHWPACVQLLPPLLRESMALPAPAVRRWLQGEAAGTDLSDLDSSASAPPTAKAHSASTRPVLRWRGPEQCEVITPDQIRPGDTLVLPARYGGCDTWGWAPASTAPVPDLADTVLAEADTPRRVALRLADGHWPTLAAAGADTPLLQERLATLQQLEAQRQDTDDDLTDALQAAQADLLAACAASAHPLLQRLHDASLEPHPHGLVLRAQGVDEVEGLIETGRAIPLPQHHADVARWARQLAGADPAAEAVEQAAAVHDAGKAEPRMQVLLHGNALLALAGPVLAKSAQRRRADQLAAWQASKLPRGFRHEFASLRYAPQADPLVAHLVASHHGHARPWGPSCADPHANGMEQMHLQAHSLLRWAQLQTTHGPWRLATLEWLVRAADARASMEEAQ